MAQNRTWTITQSGESRSFTISPGVGPSGPNNITTSTTTAISGILKGDGSTVSAAVADTDYQSVPAEGAFVDGDKTKLDGIETGAQVNDVPEYKTADFTAENNKVYHVKSAGTVTITDPTGVEGSGYIVCLFGGAVTFGFVAYTGGTSIVIRRKYINGAWEDDYYQSRTDLQAAFDTQYATTVQGTKADSALQPGTVDAADIDFDGSTDIGADLADADEIIVSDGGGNTTRCKSAMSRVWTYISGKISGVYATLTGTETLTNKTLTSPTINGGTVSGTFTGSPTISGNATVTGDLTVDTSTLKVDSANNRVGIGTASPAVALDVEGTIQASIGASPSFYVGPLPGFPTFSGMWFGATAATATGTDYTFLSNGVNSTFLNGATHVYLRTSNTTRVTVTSVGMGVGGTHTPSSALDVNGTISFETNSGTWNGTTFAGAQTFSGQVELTGQAATNSTSAMTRSLTRADEFSKIGSFMRAHLATVNPSSSGTGAGTQLNDVGVLVFSGTGLSAYGRVILQESPDRNAGIDLSRAIKMGLAINLGYSAVTDTSSCIRILMGGANTPAAADANAFTTHGFGVEIRPDGSNIRYRIICHNGTTYTQGSWVNLPHSAPSSYNYGVVVSSDAAGNVASTIYAPAGGTAYSSSTTGGPTAYTANGNYMVVAVNDSTGTPSNSQVSIKDAIVEITY